MYCAVKEQQCAVITPCIARSTYQLLGKLELFLFQLLKQCRASEMAKIQSVNCLLQACDVCIPVGNLGIPTCDTG